MVCHTRPQALILALAILAGEAHAQRGDKPGEEQRLHHSWKVPPSPPLTPEQALDAFEIEAGYRLDLVASEPLVEDPVAMAFAETGALWVVEMRGFMPNLNATEADETAPVGRVIVLDDQDGDGRFETRRVFLDGLVSPRTLAHSRKGILINDGIALFHVVDRDGDGQGDARTLVDPKYIEGGNVEHQPNGLLLGLDGWFYNAKSSKRYRYHQGHWEVGKTERRGQWGITKDDHGRLFYNYNWDQLRGDLAPPNYLQRNPNHSSVTGINLPVGTDQRVYPIRLNTGVNRGYREGILAPSGKLHAFASACAPHVYRGHLLPAFSGDAFVCGPGANIVKRNILEVNALTIQSQHAREGREFLASTDERFRPVFATGGPDGALYLIDMYRGIIQHAAYMTSYLRQEIETRELDQPVHMGRLYRVVPEGHRYQRPTLPRGEVVELKHANGWHRDTAQRLLVERNDRSVIPALREMALDETVKAEARSQALWTLAQLGDPSPQHLLPVLEANEPELAVTAIRILEGLSQDDLPFQETLAEALRTMMRRPSPAVRFQIALTIGELQTTQKIPVLTQLATWHTDLPLMRDAIMSSVTSEELKLLQALWSTASSPEEHADLLALFEALGSALTRERSPKKLSALLDWLGWTPASFDHRHEAVLAGMVIHLNNRRFQPIALPRAPRILSRVDEIANPSIKTLLEGWRGLFAWPGHTPSRRQPASKGRALTSEETRRVAAGRLHYIRLCASCHASDGDGITPLAPPLRDSEWVLGNPQRLIRILLHGLEGPIHVNGTRYAPPKIQPMMPPIAGLSDVDLANVITYIRRAFDHRESPVSSREVTGVRSLTSNRIAPWTERELLEFTLSP